MKINKQDYKAFLEAYEQKEPDDTITLNIEDVEEYSLKELISLLRRIENDTGPAGMNIFICDNCEKIHGAITVFPQIDDNEEIDYMKEF